MDKSHFDYGDLLRHGMALTGRLVVTVKGRSMAPLLRVGDRVVVVPCSPAELTPGDIVLLDGPDPVVHRYLFMNRVGLVVKGDGALSCDFAWAPERVLGRVVERYRGPGSTLLDRGWPSFRGRWLARSRWLRHRIARSLGLSGSPVAAGESG